MMNIPTIRIELQGIRETVQAMFAGSNNELTERITETLERTITEDWVQSRINEEVAKCINKAISNLSDSYTLQTALTKIIVERLENIIKGEPA